MNTVCVRSEFLAIFGREKKKLLEDINCAINMLNITVHIHLMVLTTMSKNNRQDDERTEYW